MLINLQGGFSLKTQGIRSKRKIPHAYSSEPSNISPKPAEQVLEHPHELTVKKSGSRAWWCTPVIPAIGKQRQADF